MSGTLLKSSKTTICIYETKSSGSKVSFSLPVLFVGLVLVTTSCGRLPRHYTSDSVSQDTPNSTGQQQALLTVNINTASAAELERLPGIGAVLAERIVTYRKEYGAFRRAEHLMMVRGISDRKFREIRSLVRVD